VMRDSEGRVNPDGDYWDVSGARKAPQWIDCAGKIGGRVAGVALISHPDNIRNEFYCRGWGLMICSATLGHDVQVAPRSPFNFAVRFVAHDGELTHTAAGNLHEQFADVTSALDTAMNRKHCPAGCTHAARQQPAAG